MCRPTLILALLALLTGCQLLAPAPLPLAAPMQRPHQLEHLLTLTWGDRQLRLRCVLETGQGETRVVALNEAGLVLFQLHHTDQGLSVQRSALLPKAFPAQQIMADIQLIFWPASAIEAALPATWRLDVEANSRTLYHGDRLIAQVHYQGSPWQAPSSLANQRAHYQLTLTPLGPDATP